MNNYEISGNINSAYFQVCNENMKYTNWIDDNNGYERRVLYDMNDCGFTDNKTEFRQINNKNEVESHSSNRRKSSSNLNNTENESEEPLKKSEVFIMNTTGKNLTDKNTTPLPKNRETERRKIIRN